MGDESEHGGAEGVGAEGGWERDPLGRFGDRVADYVRHRPGYPPELMTLLGAREGLRVCELGAGTGIFTALLLEAGCEVAAVEPNDGMRGALEGGLAFHPRLRVSAGRAEETGLPDGGCDLVVAAQAFHWFEPAATHREALRVLRPGGRGALIWNARRVTGSALAEAYEAFLHVWGTDYGQLSRRGVAADVTVFFGHAGWAHHRLDNHQVLDEAGFLGRLTSSSYVPAEDDPRRAPMLAAARTLFGEHAERGVVRVDYDVDVYLGTLTP
ncbi:MAG: class I SAM-dependent methyltransferase [Myxococcota bacterium]